MVHGPVLLEGASRQSTEVDGRESQQSPETSCNYHRNFHIEIFSKDLAYQKGSYK